MHNFFDTLVQVLSADKQFFSEDGILLRNKVYEHAMRMDAGLLGLLLGNEDTKKRFFTDVAGTLVFDKVGFGWIINNRQFLPDSYTRFKNRIGLTDERGNLISASDDVVLSFPYKDCVLEGGQTKEDQKRDEIFYNEKLAPDEVDRLLYPKVLTRSKRYAHSGIMDLAGHPIKDELIVQPTQALNEGDNLVIKGNNLLSIASLLECFDGRINLIYIDPPFNTGNDSFNYNDRFSRSTWLTFMKNRLAIAHRLLTRDGNLFIHIDINQSHYLKVLCDEIFEQENFVEELIWAYGSPSGGRAATPKPVNIHDYILHYAKNYSERKQNRVYVPYSEKYIKDWFKYTDKDGRKYRQRQRGTDESGNPVWVRQYLDESKGVPLSTVWTDIQQVYADPRAYKEGQKADVEVIKEFSGGQKPEALLKRILEMASNEGDIVLDFHAGTGTTGAVAHKMRRRYILCEQIDSQIDIMIKRLSKVIGGETAGISKAVNWHGGGSFVYCELAKCNQHFVDAIMTAKTDGDLKKILELVLNTGYISVKVDPADIRENAADFNALSTDDKKRFIMELLDKNMLYVNLSDLDDAEYAISDIDKAFNRSFYQIGETR